MKKLVLSALVFLASFTTHAALKREFRELKVVNQAMLQKQSINNAVIADPDRLLNDQTTSASVVTTVTSFLAQPDVCRTLSITPGSTTADVPAGDIDVTGTNALGSTITEAFTLVANQSSVENGTKAFCSVSSIVFPVQDGGGATYDVGVLDALGLNRCMDFAGHYVFSVFDGAYETTRATCIADADEVEKNTCDVNGTLDGAKDLELYFVQNFRCL